MTLLIRNLLKHATALSTTLILCAAMILGISPARAQDSSTVSYNLGEIEIVQEQFSADSRFYNMPVTAQGVLAMPEGEGPFPVVLVIHGSYPFCSALGDEVDVYPCPPENDLHQYEGFTYLAEALAAHSYIAIVPDLSAEFNNGFGEPIFAMRSNQIIEAHISALLSGDIVAEAAAKADADQLMIVSHSRGGPLGVSYINAETYAMHQVSALAMLTPAYLAPENVIPETMPTALVISECDGDVGTEQPLSYLTEQLPALRPTITTIVTLPGGTHNAFSTQLEADPHESCEAEQILESQAQRDFAAAFLPGFFAMVLDSE